ncbi:MAG: hypothetical protein H7Y06_13095 [Opitutaceae bacterium]|nr:hypothetical protein [Opitutaceae bacterium]
MPAPPRDDLRRLHFINALFAQVTGDDLYLAEQIKEAIAFSLSELEDQTREHPEFAAKYDAAFNASAARLLESFFAGQPRHGFYHWNALSTLTSATPLFARAELMTGLKRLAPHRESTLLVTNLRPALLPPEKRATVRRQREYEDALAYIRDLTAARTAPSADLRLLFL